MATISIRAVFDPACPWCYVGSVRLMRAIDAYRRAISSSDMINIVWHSYQIDPQAVTQPLMEKMASKFGREQLPRMQEQLLAMGKRDGIKFSFKSTVGNTRDAHRLIQLAKSKQGTVTEHLSTRLVMEMMKLYFEEGGDITSFKDLGLAAERAGIDRDEAIAWLVNGGGADEVRREAEEAQRMGVRGVPWYEFNGSHVLNGAAEESVFLQRLIQASNSAPKSST
ncbi:dsba oxidoreductase [Fusarium pseudocircinatum]|uniref:Dsba oxidoreductase n=1 Tax=Fusarium pseudocircinatum TaxID=56676 RepID=A0A8H5NT31_9HYPO|nr:dsba oxidoreductase [Fusarium pseudocircinatum]